MKAANLRQLAIDRSRMHTSPTKLMPREREVITLVAKGMDNKSIGNQLGISECTVRTHLVNTFQKLKVRSRTEAALYAFREGLISPDNLVTNQDR